MAVSSQNGSSSSARRFTFPTSLYHTTNSFNVEEEELTETKYLIVVPDFTEPKQQLLRVIYDNEDDASDVQQDACVKYSKWYLARIDELVRNEAAKSILSKIYVNENGRPNSLSEIQHCIYTTLAHTANALNSKNLSIHVVATQMLRNFGGEVDDDLRIACYQQAFKFISWITMLYATPGVFSEHHLELNLATVGDPSTNLPSASWRNLRCRINEENILLPLHHLLPHFGDFIPEALPPYSTSGTTRGSFHLDSIIGANISYYTLTKVAQVRIEWVDAISLHLEFDPQTAVLKVFRFPSFCAMFCIGQSLRKTLLSKIFHDTSTSDSSSTCSPTNTNEPYSTSNNGTESSEPYSQAFLKEVLCSYRAIFGPRMHFSLFFWTRPEPLIPTSLAFADPLLPQLCSTASVTHPLYTQIGCPDFGLKSVYSVRSDFPHLGSRLLQLQDFVETRNPSDLRTLWHDRRDLLKFYTFWAVVIVGGVGLLVGVLQTVAGFGQVALAWEALHPHH